MHVDLSALAHSLAAGKGCREVYITNKRQMERSDGVLGLAGHMQLPGSVLPNDKIKVLLPAGSMDAEFPLDTLQVMVPAPKYLKSKMTICDR